MYHFVGIKGKFKFFKHILVSKQKGKITGVLQKLLKMVTYSLQAERRALEDIFAAAQK